MDTLVVEDETVPGANERTRAFADRMLGHLLTGRAWIQNQRRNHMGMGRGILLWLLGVPLPIIILLAIFWR